MKKYILFLFFIFTGSPGGQMIPDDVVLPIDSIFERVSLGNSKADVTSQFGPPLIKGARGEFYYLGNNKLVKLFSEVSQKDIKNGKIFLLKISFVENKIQSFSLVQLEEVFTLK